MVIKWVTVKSAIYMDRLRNFSLSIFLIIYGVFIESLAASSTLCHLGSVSPRVGVVFHLYRLHAYIPKHK